MKPPNPRTPARLVELCIFALVAFMVTACEQKEPGHTINAGPTAEDVEIFAKRQNFVTKTDHKEALYKAYMKGAKDQAVSQAQLKPIFITEFRNGELLVFEVTDRFRDTLPTLAQAEALIEATEAPLPKKK
jgi:hypothetical protein